MKQPKNSIESLPEHLRFDCESNSNISVMDQPIYQNNLPLNTVEPTTLAEFLLPSNDENMDYMAINPQNIDVLGVWNLQGPNTSPFLENQESDDESKVAHGWNSTLSISSGGTLRMMERCYERNILSLENADLNLNNTPVDDGESLNLFNVSQSAEPNERTGIHSNNMEVSLCPFMPDFFEVDREPYSNLKESSSGAFGHVSEDDGRARNFGRLLACKRKNMEGVTGESSTNHNISPDLNITTSSVYLPSGNSLENQNPSFSCMNRGASSEWYPPSSFSRNAETSQRNVRARHTLSHQNDVSSSQSHITVSNRLPSDTLPDEQSSVPNHFIQSTEQSQPHSLPASVLHHHIHNSPSSSRIGNPSVPVFLRRRSRLIAAHEETYTRSLPINGVTNHPTRTRVDLLAHNPPQGNSVSSGLSLLRNRVDSSSDIIPLPGSTREPRGMVPVQYCRNLTEAVQSSLFPTGGSESGHQRSAWTSRHSGRSTSTREAGQSSRTVRQSYSQPYPQREVSIDRQHILSTLTLSARSRDRRSRVISEIRNALDLMRSGVNFPFEDVFHFDQPGFFGLPNLHDRHRGMRLDVDNMSYEELLALEEKIGYVSTGLSEQVVLKCLKKHKFSTYRLEVVSGEQEPCSICQESYSEGEDIGTLDCSHDFHTDCIKQWLMLKNLCPICKTTALAEAVGTMTDDNK